MDNISNFVKAFKESAATEVSNEEDLDSIMIKSAGEMLGETFDTEEVYHLPSHYCCV